MFNVDFSHKSPQVLCHKNYEHHIPSLLKKLEPYHLEDHFIMFSSGTTGGDLKGYALSKTALFKNASAVNDFFRLNSSDVWALSLPVYHVGGLSVLARAQLLGNQVRDVRQWSVHDWSQRIQSATVTSLVPTQLYDLVKNKITPPKSLKKIFIGGDFLSSSLKQKALDLGLPVIRTFGMSEVCSQLASCETPESNDLKILPIHKVKTKDSRLYVKSDSLFTLEFHLGEVFRVFKAEELCDEEGFYKTNDRAALHGNLITPLGRLGDEIKVSGHLVNFNSLRDTLSTFLMEKELFQTMEFLIENDERKGKKLVLLIQGEDHKELVDELKERISPVKIDDLRFVSSFNRTSLGKLIKT